MKRILVIDDEQGFCSLVKEILEPEGYKVLMCSDSRKAFGQAMATKPDLILLDIKMPVKSGDIVASELENNAETRDIPIVFVSVLLKDQEANLYNNVIGHHFVLSKPLKVKTLKNVIKMMLKGPATI